MYIEKLDNKARGICYVDGKITFVEDALPKEDVEIEIYNSKKKYNEAKVVKYNKLSPDRIEVKCPYYKLCGGCDLLHLKYEKELQFKKEKVKSILKKYGDIDIEIDNIISPNEYNYRNKATFQVKEKIGYYKKKSYDVIDIDKCLIVDEKINDILNKIRQLDLKNINKIMIRTSKNTNDTMLVIYCSGKIDLRFKELDITSIYQVIDDEYKVIKGTDYIKEKIGNLVFNISPKSFFQVNTEGALELYEKVLEFSKLNRVEKVLDLYCGTGTIGLFLSSKADKVLGIEINESSIKDAIENKKNNQVRNIDFICDDAKNVCEKGFDVVIVDPPRKGLDNNTINYLLNLDAKRIVYVSCDPITLARDLNILKNKYNLDDLTLVNMFPKTEHVETVSVLCRKAIEK